MGGRGANGIGNAVSFSSKREANTFFGVNKGDFKDWVNNLSGKEQTALDSYTVSGYAQINRTLRNDGYSKAPQHIQNSIDEIKNAISRFELKQDIVVYRGVDDNFLGGNYSSKDIQTTLIGKTITDKAFSSCSVLRKGAFDRPYVLEIRVPRGKGRGAYIDPISTGKGEGEFLLQMNTSFKITGARDDGKKIVVQVTAK